MVMDYLPNDIPMERNNKQNFFTSFVVVSKGIKSTWPVIGLFVFCLGWGWNAFGSKILDEKIGSIVDMKQGPVIEVLDNTYYETMKNTEMMERFLKENQKEHIIGEAKEAVSRQKEIDYTRKKIGKSKYIIKEVK